MATTLYRSRPRCIRHKGRFARHDYVVTKSDSLGVAEIKCNRCKVKHDYTKLMNLMRLAISRTEQIDVSEVLGRKNEIVADAMIETEQMRNIAREL